MGTRVIINHIAINLSGASELLEPHAIQLHPDHGPGLKDLDTAKQTGPSGRIGIGDDIDLAPAVPLPIGHIHGVDLIGGQGFDPGKLQTAPRSIYRPPPSREQP